MAILDFSVSGWHGFGSVTQVCFGISVSNFMCMSFVSVGRSLKIASYVAFKMAALWFWTMFNCNPPIAHCHPLLWGGGILVDHWSTISSCYWQTRILTTIAHAQTNRRASRVSALALLLIISASSKFACFNFVVVYIGHWIIIILFVLIRHYMQMNAQTLSR